MLSLIWFLKVKLYPKNEITFFWCWWISCAQNISQRDDRASSIKARSPGCSKQKNFQYKFYIGHILVSYLDKYYAWLFFDMSWYFLGLIAKLRSFGQEFSDDILHTGKSVIFVRGWMRLDLKIYRIFTVVPGSKDQ